MRRETPTAIAATTTTPITDITIWRRRFCSLNSGRAISITDLYRKLRTTSRERLSDGNDGGWCSVHFPHRRSLCSLPNSGVRNRTVVRPWRSENCFGEASPGSGREGYSLAKVSCEADRSRTDGSFAGPSAHRSLAYSVLASLKIGISGSASFHKARKLLYCFCAFGLSPVMAFARASCKRDNAPRMSF